MPRTQTERIQRERKQHRADRAVEVVSRDTSERRKLCLAEGAEHEGDEAVNQTDADSLQQLLQAAQRIPEVQIQERQTKCVVSVRGDFQTQHIQRKKDNPHQRFEWHSFQMFGPVF